jgi:hypothetical protein
MRCTLEFYRPDLFLSDCGNGVLDSGEECDIAIPSGPGSCPTVCDSGDPCIADALLNAGTCAAQCQATDITFPLDGDGCCPPGANAASDDDCEAVCGNLVCEPGEVGSCTSDCDCTDDDQCSDQYVCTVDRCITGSCTYEPGTYGDVDGNGFVNIFDLFCILDGFASDFSNCSFEDDDIHPCGGNGFINIFDLFAVLDAFQQIDACCGG